MQYKHQKEVLPRVQEKSKKEIDAVNRYIDSLKGTIVSIEIIRRGQSRPYTDSIDEALIFCHQPNVLTTNAPFVRTITREQAKVLARIFVGSWEETPKYAFESRLELLKPTPNPCDLDEQNKSSFNENEDRASCWRVVIRHPYSWDQQLREGINNGRL